MFFLVAHYLAKEWIGYHSASPWAPSFAKVDFTGMLKNGLIITWRLLDYGRWIVFPVLIFLFTKVVTEKTTRYQYLLLVAIMGLFLLPSMVFHQYLSAHRYLLPILFSIQLLLYVGLFSTSSISKSLKNKLFGLVIISLFTGNLWVYPLNIAQGWDATLAHLPYYQSKATMLSYLNNHDIDFREIGTAFPEIGPIHHRQLNHQLDSLSPLNFNKNQYVLVSNIMNDITKEQWRTLQNDWTLVHEVTHWPIIFSLYQKQQP